MDGVMKEVNRGGLEQLSVRGWRKSKAASNDDGGVASLIGFLEKKASPSDQSLPRVKITKVCLQPPSGCRQRLRNFALSGSLSF